MFDDTVLDWFCLINSKGIGPKTFWALMRSYKSANESLRHIANPFSRREAEKILKTMNCGVILASDSAFPSSLRRSCLCPPMLFFKGDKSILQRRRISVIGARNASINGRAIAQKLSLGLSPEFAIVSGLAKGIDSAAHLGALECSTHKSAVAVLPTGFDNIYPKENQKLYEKISEFGLVLTEVSNMVHNEQGMFQLRNRIIALLSEAIIVIEAAPKSGTMATAKMALDFGCELLVVPGSPADPRNFGSNLLIKNGATLIQSHNDVFDILGISHASPQKSMHIVCEEKNQQAEKETLYEKVLSQLSATPISIDEISIQTNIDVKKLLCVISELEILGKVAKYSTNEVLLLGE